VPDHQQELAAGYGNLAQALLTLDKKAAAEKASLDAVETQRKLVRAIAPVPDFLSRLGALLDNRALLLLSLNDPKRLAEAQELLRESQSLHQKALETYREHPSYRERYGSHLTIRYAVFFDQGDYQSAAKTVPELPRLLPDDCQTWRKAAGLLAQCATKATKDEPLARAYQKQALEYLQEAARRGYDNYKEAKEAKDLKPLMDLPEFTQWLSQIEKKAKAQP
jgi:tetratricopeptide (TPR) repeat protein